MTEMDKQIVVFDFDKTLTYKDTILGFFRHSDDSTLYPFKLIIYCCAMVLTKFKVISTCRLKSIGIKLFLLNMERAELERKAAVYASKIKFNKVYFNQFKAASENENIIPIIVSASFHEYLKYIFPVHQLIASHIMYKNNRVRDIELECMGSQKVISLKKKNITWIDVLYTDSISDAAMAELAGKIYLVRGDEVIACSNYNDFIQQCKR
ncbi:MAG TPA: HAD family hydrolase [Chitinophagaceae bacterium]|nr:HAD family hydrolase [Chitinophagaceae bacterium]